MKKEVPGDIFYKDKLKFKNNKKLEQYYENKWKKEGYKKGWKCFGMNISNRFDKARKQSAIKLLNHKKRDIILDVGCGRGDVSLKIAKKAEKVYAIDIAKSGFEKIKKNSPKNLIFKKMNIENLGFKDETFDKLVCVETLEHVLHPEKAIGEMKRVLKKQGIIVLSYPTIDTSIMAKVDHVLGTEKPCSISEHITEWDYNRVVNEFEKQGFKLMESEGIVFNIGGVIGKLKRTSKSIAKLIFKIQLSIRNFPRNSTFVTFKFQKQ